MKSEYNEPWEYNPAHEIGDSEGYYVGSSREYKERIVACVNACAGITTEALEAGVVKEMVELAKVSGRIRKSGILQAILWDALTH